MNIYHILLLFYPIVLLIITFFGARVSRGKNAPDYLNIEQTKAIQAVACVAIILHHLTQHVTGFGASYKGPVTLLNYLGYLFTAIFFFVSGYGLYISFLEKPDYLKTFPARRFPSVLIPFWIINTLGVLLCALGYGIRYNLSDALSDIFGLTLVNSNGWFIVEIAVLYFLFYATFNLIKNKDVALSVMCVFVIALIIYSSLRGHDAQGDKSHWFKGEWWYNSTITFSFGMVYARFKKAIERFCEDRYRIMMTVFSILTVIVVFFVSAYVVLRFGYYHDHMYSLGRRDEIITLIVQSVSCLVFVMFVLLLNMRITIGNRVLKYLSGISVELFLIHGYFVNRIFSDLHMKDFWIFAIVLISSIACTAAISPLIKKITAGVIRLLCREKKYNDTLESEAARKKHERNVRLFKILAAAMILIVFSLTLTMTFARTIFARSEYEAEMNKLRNAAIGDEVRFGHIEEDWTIPGQERIKWIVIEREGDEVRLLSKEGIAGSYYHQKHEKVSWHNCDLRQMLNSDSSLSSFSKYEYERVIQKNGDMVSLLSPGEAEELFKTDEERKIDITKVAEAQGTNTNKITKMHQWDMKGYGSSWWWLKGESGVNEITAPIVNVEGEVVMSEKYVNKPGGAVRPVIWVDCAE